MLYIHMYIYKYVYTTTHSHKIILKGWAIQLEVGKQSSMKTIIVVTINQ